MEEAGSRAVLVIPETHHSSALSISIEAGAAISGTNYPDAPKREDGEQSPLARFLPLVRGSSPCTRRPMRTGGENV